MKKLTVNIEVTENEVSISGTGEENRHLIGHALFGLEQSRLHLENLRKEELEEESDEEKEERENLSTDEKIKFISKKLGIKIPSNKEFSNMEDSEKIKVLSNMLKKLSEVTKKRNKERSAGDLY